MITLLKKTKFFKEKHIERVALIENQGYCNENYLVVADGKKYILRKLLRPDINRNFEYEVQKLAFDKGITAEPLVYDEENAFMLFRFLEGKHKTLEVETSVPHTVKFKSSGGTEVSTSEDDLKLLAETLQKLHSIHIDTKPIDLTIQNKTDEVLTAFKTIENYPKDHVLCHNDLNPQNIFFSNDVKFIDWEYASMNDRYFDLACVCVEFGLESEMKEVFLEAYFEGDDFIMEKLEAYMVVYGVLCEEWFAENH